MAKDWKRVRVKRGFELIADVWKLAKKHHAWIAGGYVRYMCSPLEFEYSDEEFHNKLVAASDIDLFPRDYTCYQNLIDELTIRQGFELTFENDMCATYRFPENRDTRLLLQVIKPTEAGQIKTTGTLQEVLDYFDFTVIRIGLIGLKTALGDIDFKKDETDHKLVIKHIACPISSVTRIVKYAKKGYQISVSQIVKLFIDWDERGADYRARLMEIFDKQAKTGELTQQEINELERLLRID